MTQAEQAVKKTGEASKETATQTDKLAEKQETAAQKTKRLARETKQLAEEVATAKRLIGGYAVGVGAAILGMTALTVKAAVEWETAWTGVTKTVEGTPEELGAVEDGLRDLTKVLPASHTEIAAVAEAAGQLGVQSKNVVAFTKTMIDLGETTNLSANEAATSLARFMNVMGTSQGMVGNLGSALVELGNNYATTEAEILAMGQRLSGAAKQIGLTEGETLGLATALSSVGIEAEAGGSAVSKVMIDIASSVDKGGERVEKFAKISGVSADEFAKKWKTDPGAALALFVKGLSNAEAQGESTLGVLEDLGITEVRMRDALLRSAAASNEFTNAMQTGNDAVADNTALAIEASKRYATTASKLEIMKNNVVDAAIAFGDVFLPVISGASDAVSAFAGFLGDLPEPVQGVTSVMGFAAGAVLLLGGVMLLAVPKIAEFKAALTLLNTTMSRTAAVGGIVGVAITALVLILSAVAGANADAAAKTKAYGDTIDVTTGKITGATREMVKLNLATKGSIFGVEGDSAYDAAEKLGIGLDLITDAATGDVAALEALQKELDIGTQDSMARGGTATAEMAEIMARTGLTMAEVAAAADLVGGAVAGETSSIEEAIRVAKQKESVDKTGTDNTEDAADAYGGLAVEVDVATTAIGELADELDKLNGKNLDAREAARQLEAAYDDFDASLKENGTTLDITTEKGRNNQAALDDIAKAALDSGQNIADSGGSWQQYQASLESSRAALLIKIADLGITGQAAEDLADNILQIPPESEWKMRAETDIAEARLRRIQNLINGIGATSTLHISSGPGSGGITQADGGKVNFYANGGRENHIAQFARAGTTRVWAEPETGGEWYIPAAASKRQRSTQILSEAASEFGYQLVPAGAQTFGDGGRTGGFDSAPAAAGAQIYMPIYAQPGMSEETVGRIAADQLKFAMRRA